MSDALRTDLRIRGAGGGASGPFGAELVLVERTRSDWRSLTDTNSNAARFSPLADPVRKLKTIFALEYQQDIRLFCDLQITLWGQRKSSVGLT